VAARGRRLRQGFVRATQQDAWGSLVARHAGEAAAEANFLRRLAKELDERGTVDVLRHGVKDLGVEIRLAYFRPAHGLTPQLVERYEANRLVPLAARARTNTFDNFRLVFDRTFIDTVVQRMDQNADIFKRILDDTDFQQTMLDYSSVLHHDADR
jgi:hypothetical protein